DGVGGGRGGGRGRGRGGVPAGLGVSRRRRGSTGDQRVAARRISRPDARAGAPGAGRRLRPPLAAGAGRAGAARRSCGAPAVAGAARAVGTARVSREVKERTAVMRARAAHTSERPRRDRRVAGVVAGASAAFSGRRFVVRLCVAGAIALGLSLTQAQTPPNVLLITLDTVRADHVGAYGFQKAGTPTLDRL